MLELEPRPFASKIPALAVIFILVMVGLVFAGWLFDVPALLSIGRGLPVMTLRTGFMFLLAALSLALYHGMAVDPDDGKWRRRSALALAVFLLLLDLAMGLIYLTTRASASTQLFGPSNQTATGLALAASLPASPQTIITFLFISIGLISLYWHSPRANRVLGFGTLTAQFLPALALLGYAAQVSYLFRLTPLVGMSLPTIANFMVLCLGMLFMRPNVGLSALLQSRQPGGIVTRRLILMSIVIPPAVGFVAVLGRRLELYDTVFESAFLALITTYVLTAAIWWYGSSLNRLDGERQRARLQVTTLLEQERAARSDAERLAREMEQSVAIRTAELEVSRERLRSTLMTLSDLVFVIDSEGTFVEFYQPEGHDDLYLPPEIFLGRHYSEVMPSELVQGFQSVIELLKTTHEVQEFTYELPIHDKRQWFSARLTPRFDVTDTYAGCTMIARNVSDRVAMETNLRYQATILNNIFDAVIGTDGNLMITSWNAGAERTYGHKAEEVLGKSVSDILRTEYYATTAEAAFSQLQATGSWSGEVIQSHKDGRRIHVLSAVSVIVDDAGQIQAVIGVNHDFSERRQLELDLLAAKEQAEAANRAKSIFLANVSHEIRTPMNAIIGVTDLLADTELTAEQGQFIAMIQGSGEALLAIINDILDLSKIEAHQLELESEPFSLPNCIDTAFSMARNSQSETSAEMLFWVHDDVPDIIIGDEGRLRQILVNLLTNALKFTPRGHVSLDVMVAAAGGGNALTLHFAVQDTGIGISEASLDRLFQPFRQVDNSATRRHTGTGLGLAICKNLVEMMGGEIWVESTLDVGSTFNFTIQAAAAATPLNSAAPKSELPAFAADMAAGMPLRILIVEDNEINQMLAQAMLTKFGYDVDLAANGQAALDALQVKTYDLILMDIQMPVMDGLTATRRIRESLPPDRQPYITALTANATPEYRQLCLESGMNDYLSKPFRATDLAQVLARVEPVGGDAGAAAAAVSADGAAADPARFEQVRQLMPPDELPEFVEAFLIDAGRLITAISRAMAAEDTAAQARSALTLASTAGQFGALRLAETARQMAQPGAASRALIETARAELTAAAQALRAQA